MVKEKSHCKQEESKSSSGQHKRAPIIFKGSAEDFYRACRLCSPGGLEEFYKEEIRKMREIRELVQRF